jgi:glycosyltransferase EpsE
MTKNPLVSVVMADFNTKPKHLHASVKSIMSQTLIDFELILVNDGSSNDMEVILRDIIDPRVKIINNATNRGLVYSLNRGISESKSEYIVRMDTDDISLPNRFELLYGFIKEHPEYDVVGSRAMEFSDDCKNGILGHEGEKTKYSVMVGDSLIHPSVIFKKDTIVALGMYEQYRRAEDLALWLKLLSEGKRLYVLNDILLNYRVEPDDYKKRKIRDRMGEIKVRLEYYPKLGARARDYMIIVRSLFAGILPSWLVRIYRIKFVLNRK